MTRLSNISFFISLLLLGECVVEGTPRINIDSTATFRIPLPFLRVRGGSTSTAIQKQKHTSTTKRQRTKRRGGGPPPPIILINNIKQGLGKVGGASNIGKNIGREWSKITSTTRKFFANIPKLLPHPNKRKKRAHNLKAHKLDDVCHAFSSVQKGNEVDTAQLLKACKAHLAFMKNGGSSLRLVAKDLESNMHKAEKVYKKSPKEHKCLSSLLQCEKDKDIHNGDELHEKSAAMGLLWIRRSLAFQLDLYSSLIHGQVHPKEAAYCAYKKHLAPYHGWALRKVFPASLTAMPDREVFIAKCADELHELNEEEETKVVRKLRALISTLQPLLAVWKDEFIRLDLEDTRRV